MGTSGILRIGVAVALAATVAGCSQINSLKARKAFKDANTAYLAEDYKEAAELYEAVVAANPDETRAYFYIANSYDNLYKPDLPDDPANRANIEKAVKFYQESADKLAGAQSPAEKTLRLRSYEYLAAAYGEDRLNDPAKAEPIVQKMIEIEPSEPTNYFRLARLYEDAGVYDEAERMYVRAKEVKPGDPTVYTTLAAYYNRRGEFEKTIKALEDRAAKEPTNPEAFHTIASYYWDETRNDPKLTDAQKLEYIQRGLKAADRAIELKQDYVEAIVFKGLLLRLQALVEKTPARQKQLLDEATKLSERANAMREKQATGAAATPAAAPPKTH
jgi:tetratricopeptide (TPR) repeat protein